MAVYPNPKTEAQLRAAFANQQSASDTTQADLDALEAVAVTAAASFGLDNAVLRADGVSRGAQNSNATLSDAGQLTLNATSPMDGPTLGAELLDATGWAGTNWTGDGFTGSTHTPGSTADLTNTLAAVVGVLYDIKITMSGRTANSITVTFGGAIGNAAQAINGEWHWGVLATTTGSFSVTPGSSFDGTVACSIKEITGPSTPNISMLAADGTTSWDVRTRRAGVGAPVITGGFCLGPASGGNIISSQLANFNFGVNNFIVGRSCGRLLTTGSGNVMMGVNCAPGMTTGNNNMALGGTCFQSLVTGDSNVGMGINVLRSIISGNRNVGVGRGAGFSVTGSGNVGIGYYAAGSVTTGSNNTFIGRYAGYTGQTGTVSNSTGIGNGAVTIASNQMVLGNTSVTRTDLRGNTGIGVAPPTGGVANSVALLQTSDPTGVAANSGGIFVKDVGGTAELFGFNETPVVRQLTGITTPIAGYGAGTAYTLTATSAEVDRGTTDSAITLPQAGTYKLGGRVTIRYAAATFSVERTITLKLQRTNNTAADVTNSAATMPTFVLTLLTGGIEMTIPEVSYTTTNTNDRIALFIDVDTLPDAGSLEVTGDSVYALRVS